MKLFRHLGLMIAAFWCAAMIIVPLAAAADAGRGINQGMNQGISQPGSLGMNPGQTDRGNNQMQQAPGQGTGPGGTMNQQGNGQNIAGPGQSNQPGGTWNMTLHDKTQGRITGNITAFGNRSLFKPDDSHLTTLPPENPEWDPANATVMGNLTWHGHGNGNITDIPPPIQWDPANTTTMNNTSRHGHGDMDTTTPAPHGQGNAPGQQQDQQSAQDQMNSTGELLARLIAWLKANAGS